MDTILQIHVQGQWHRAAMVSATDRGLRFEYLPDYVFGNGPRLPVTLGLPVRLDTVRATPSQARTPLAFLWDLVPQGAGRQHLAGLLGVSDQDPAQDLYLAAHGAFAPIGQLRLETAVEFYRRQAGDQHAAGFSLADMIQRNDAFLDQLTLHGMLAAGTPGVQGVARKFLLVEGNDGRWYPDMALDDAEVQRHWIVKLPRGREPVDRQILRHEAIYLRAAAACGLRSIPDVRHEADMLFLPRFDRRVEDGRVVRLHQETFASLIGASGFGRGASMFELVSRLAEVATDPATEIAEFLCRDAFNRALRNPDNHLRNSSVQRLPDGTVQLTPLYDIGPMYRDPELVTRTCQWRTDRQVVVDDWPAIVEHLGVNDAVRRDVAVALHRFGVEHVPRLPELLRRFEADERIVQDCLGSIEAQVSNLQEIGIHGQAS
ncbi:HipA domain-containing protein [Luteimonas sp. 8-5]|uniref:type II toxin-antitoxin system HipA family toxin n=1 Tax=Luteimonas sp. 8-5 TaxID=3039387 RepID=UPI0024365BB7|nr:HipA domain-containing protein [Luteimonas sp. 8-5]MDG6348271.1 HipA domain-containing protein [Luteimonas sp. 8-5]